MSISYGTRLVQKGERRPQETGFIVNADTTVLVLEGKAADAMRKEIADLSDYVTYITTQSPEAVGDRLGRQPRHKTELGRQALLGTVHKAWRFLYEPTELTLVTGAPADNQESSSMELLTYPLGRVSLNRSPNALTNEVLQHVFPQAFSEQSDPREQTAAASAFVLAGPANTLG